MTGTYDRRSVLRAVGATSAAAAVPLAGCGGAPENGEGEETTEAAETTPSGGDGGEWVETDTVEMTDELTFEPDRIQVSAGTTVTWENVGSIGHTVTAYEDEIPDDAAFFASGGFEGEQAARDGYPDQGNIPGGDSYEHTFETTGEYHYFCIPHELNGMVGYVKVV